MAKASIQPNKWIFLCSSSFFITTVSTEISWYESHYLHSYSALHLYILPHNLYRITFKHSFIDEMNVLQKGKQTANIFDQLMLISLSCMGMVTLISPALLELLVYTLMCSRRKRFYKHGFSSIIAIGISDASIQDWNFNYLHAFAFILL